MQQPTPPEATPLVSISLCELQAKAWADYAASVVAWAAKEAKRAEGATAEAERQRSALMSGLTAEEVALARSAVYLNPPGQWKADSYPSRTLNDWEHVPLKDVQRLQVEKAIRQIAGGEPASPYEDLRRFYMGTKSYAHWTCQAIQCEYGFGPRHGSVTMEVGLQPAHRGGHASDALCLPPDVAEAAIKALRFICEGQVPVDLLKR